MSERCCHVGPEGQTCDQPAAWWLGSGRPDDCTHACAAHLAIMRRAKDVVWALGDLDVPSPLEEYGLSGWQQALAAGLVGGMLLALAVLVGWWLSLLR